MKLRTSAAVLFISLGLASVCADPISLAFLDFKNLSANPRFDYLEGMVRGILLFDLSSQEQIKIVDRSDLDSVLREQELRLTNLTADPDQAIEVGRLLGADYLLKGEYVFLGREVLVTVTVIDVESARSLTFSERGGSENLLHALAEQIIFRLTGYEVTLQSEQKERSIISLQDESPGSIALHCNLIDAEIFLDDEFVAYTIGNEREALLLEDISPGTHVLRIRLHSFGVVKEPEITFHDWEQELDIKAGKRHVIRARIRHFNDTIFRLKQLIREEIKIKDFKESGSVRVSRDASFVDREADPISVKLDLLAMIGGDQMQIQCTVTYQGEERLFELAGGLGERKDLEETFGKVVLKLSYDTSRVSYALWRGDIQQNMFR